MTTLVYPITENDQEIEIDLRNVGLGVSLEIGVSGNLDGGTITPYRRCYNAAGDQVGEDLPLAFSWQNQNNASISDSPIGGLTFERLQPESSIVFVITGATAPDALLLVLGIQPNG